MSWVTTTNRPTRGRQRRGAVEGDVLERLRLDMQPRKPVLTIDLGEGVSGLVVQERVPRRLLLATTWPKGKRRRGRTPRVPITTSSSFTACAVERRVAPEGRRRAARSTYEYTIVARL